METAGLSGLQVVQNGKRTTTTMAAQDRGGRGPILPLRSNSAVRRTRSVVLERTSTRKGAWFSGIKTASAHWGMPPDFLKLPSRVLQGAGIIQVWGLPTSQRRIVTYTALPGLPIVWQRTYPMGRLTGQVYITRPLTKYA